MKDKSIIQHIVPDGKWHVSVKSPEGYGFDTNWDRESEVVELLEMLIKCSKEPEGLAARVSHCVEVVSFKLKSR